MYTYNHVVIIMNSKYDGYCGLISTSFFFIELWYGLALGEGLSAHLDNS